MKPQCIEAVNLAAGRVLSAAEIKGIDSRISSTMRRLAQQDPDAWRAMPMDQRVLSAATEAMAELKADAARKVANVQRQVLATAATQERIAAQQKSLKSNQGRALVQDIDNTGHYISGVKRQYVAGLMDLVAASRSGDGAHAGRKALMFLFDAENKHMTGDLVTEIFGNGAGGTGNKLAQQGAKAWLDTIEAMRQRFNAAGGDVGKLAYGYLPQPHDATRVRAVGRDAWADKVLPLLDRKRYLNEDGSRMSDPEMLNMLRAAYETIATEGINKTEPGAFKGTGAKANKGSESRQIHFKDGESYLAYMGDFGRGSMYDAMIGHVGALARDIGLVERYGPNPNAQFRLQVDRAQRADPQPSNKLKGLGQDIADLVVGPEAMWNLVTGVTGTPAGAGHLAALGQHTRNIQVFGKLAGAVISSLTDLSTMMVTTGYNKLSYWDLFKNVGKQGSKETREFLTQHGVIAESMISDLNRWAGENLLNNWSGRLANSTMKLSLMNAWTDTMRRGFAMTMMQGMAKLSQKKWGDLTEWDRAHLGRKGITEADWEIISQAKLTDFEGRQYLTPEAIAAGGQMAEPPVPAGMTRLYHGSATHGRYDGKAWFSSNRAYAENYRGKSAELQYVDYPTTKVNAIVDPDGYGQTVEAGFTANIELDVAETGLRRPLKAEAANRARINEVTAKVLGFITDESEYAVLNPDMATRAVQTWGGQQAGTVPGELARLTMQFKSFPIAMISRHWRRAFEGQRGLDGAPAAANKAMYGMALMLTTTALGAIVFQMKQIKDGKDPVPMNTSKFWVRAAAQGGGAGFLSDILLGDTTEDRGQFDTTGKVLLGPSFDSLSQIVELSKGNFDEWKAGKDTHLGAEALRFAKGHSPYVNLWYGKAALDHLLLHNIQEALSPGYLQRIQNKARKDWGQEWWWTPGEATPDRGPDFSQVAQ